jgi:iron(III) transport system substrate-binding protein
MRSKSTRVLLAVGALAVGVFGAACGSDSDPLEPGSTADSVAPSPGGSLDGTTITVYSGRGEDLIAGVLEQFEEETGATVDVRYGDSAQLALQIDTEGDQSPADVFISQSPGAVGFLDEQGRLGALDDSTLERVEPEFRSTSSSWVGITARVRVLVYNTELVDPADLPDSVLELTNPEYKGKVGVAPSNGSFQDFVTAMRAELGDDATAEWLAGMAANESPNYAKNSAILDAVVRGEVEMGLVNHYYLLEALEEDPSLPAANHRFADGDLGSLLIVSTAAVVDTTDDDAASNALVAYLLSDDAQRLSSDAEKEYPLAIGVEPAEGLGPMDELIGISVDLNKLAEGLAGTQTLIDDSGIVR